MAPKAKKGGEGPPPPPPEPNPEEQLPDDIRELEEPPFHVTWQAVPALVQLDPEIRAEPLRETLKRKQLVRTPHVQDLSLRLDPTTQLGADIRAAQDEWVAAGNTYETFVATAAQAAAILTARFDQERRWDWKVELHRRRSEHQAATEALQAAEDAASAAAEAAEAAQVLLEEWREAKAAADDAAELEELDDEAQGPSPEERACRAAQAQAQAAQTRVEEAKQRLVEAVQQLDVPFVRYQPYWMEGITGGIAAVQQIAETGLVARAVIWGKVQPERPAGDADGVDAGEASALEQAEEAAVPAEGDGMPRAATPSTPGDIATARGSTAGGPPPAGAADATDTAAADAPAANAVGPELYEQVKQAAKSAGWGSVFGLMVALNVQLPPSPPEAPPVEAVDPKKKPAAKGKGKAKEVEVEAPPPPPEDAPGWEALYSVFVELVERVKAYDEWRQRVKVVQPLGSQLSAGAARTEAAAGSEADAGGEASVAPEGTAAAGDIAAANAEATTPEAAPDADPPAASGAPAMDYYQSLLEGVDSERMSVPLLMHCVLEQVEWNVLEERRQARRLQGEEGEGEDKEQQEPEAEDTALQARAEALAAASLAQALAGALQDEGPVLLPPAPAHSWQYTLVQQGNELSAAAAGIHTGAARPHCKAPTRDPGSPMSPLDDEVHANGHGTGSNSEAASEVLDAAVQGAAFPFLLGSGLLDVDAVETHMLKVAHIPGVAECLAASPPHDPVAKALRDSAIRAQGGDGVTLGAVQRFELLHAATELLPPGARAAHEGEMLSRHHTESFDAETLKQVINAAVLQLPHHSLAYSEEAGAVVLTCYAGDYQRQEGGGLPVAQSFSTYWERTAEAQRNGKDLPFPDMVYLVPPELAVAAESGVVRQLQYSPDGTIISTGGAAPAVISKGNTSVTVSAADGTPRLVATLEGGTTLCAYRADTPPPPPPPPPPAEPSPEEVAKAEADAAAAAAAATAAAAAAAAAAAEKPSSAKKGAKGAKGKPGSKPGSTADAAPSTPEPVPVATIQQAAPDAAVAAEEPDTGPPMPPVYPVLALQVCTRRGTLVDVSTEGRVTLTPAATDASGSALKAPPARGVDTYGAPIPSGDLSSLVPPAVTQRVVYPDGALATTFSDGSLRVLHADGTISERLARVEGWVNPEDGSDAKGWLRTLLNGTRYRQPDEGSVPATASPRTDSEDPEGLAPVGAAAAAAAELPAATPFYLELPPLATAEVSDHTESAALILMREDHMMHISYPDGQTLIIEADGTRIGRLAMGGWAVQFEGPTRLPAVFGDGAGEVQTSPVPGITMWRTMLPQGHGAAAAAAGVASGSVSAVLPDGAVVAVCSPGPGVAPGASPDAPPPRALGLAVFVPSGSVVAAEPRASGVAMATVLRHLEVLQEGAEPAYSLADTPGWTGCTVLDLVTGSAAMRGNPKARPGGDPPGFKIAPGCRQVTYWPAPPPLLIQDAAGPGHGHGHGHGYEHDGSAHGRGGQGRHEGGFRLWSPDNAPGHRGGQKHGHGHGAQGQGHGQEQRHVQLAAGGSGQLSGWGGGAGAGAGPEQQRQHHQHHHEAAAAAHVRLVPAPIAPGVTPRAFVLTAGGEHGYEVLPASAVAALTHPPPALTARFGQFPPWQLRESRPLPGADEPSVSLHSLVLQIPTSSPPLALPPLPVGLVGLAQRNTPAVREASPGGFRRMDSGRSPFADHAAPSAAPPHAPAGMLHRQDSSAVTDPRDTAAWQYVPRLVAYEPLQVSPAPGPPVLLSRQIVQYPAFTHAQVSAIRSLLDAAHEASASKWAQQGAAVPLPDDRADEEQEAESEVVAMILETRKQHSQRAARGVGSRDGQPQGTRRRRITNSGQDSEGPLRTRLSAGVRVSTTGGSQVGPGAAPAHQHHASAAGGGAGSSRVQSSAGRDDVLAPRLTGRVSMQGAGWGGHVTIASTAPTVAPPPPPASDLRSPRAAAPSHAAAAPRSSPSDAAVVGQHGRHHASAMPPAPAPFLPATTTTTTITADHPHVAARQLEAAGDGGVPGGGGVSGAPPAPLLQWAVKPRVLPPRLPNPNAYTAAYGPQAARLYEGGAAAAAAAEPPKPPMLASGQLQRTSMGGSGAAAQGSTHLAGSMRPAGAASREQARGAQQQLGASILLQAGTGAGRGASAQPPRLQPLPAAYVQDGEQYLEQYTDSVPGGGGGGSTQAAALLRLSPGSRGGGEPAFSLKPPHVHFGVVEAGAVSHRVARLRNSATVPAHFGIVRPALPLRVIHRPGPVPPGREALLTLEFVGQALGDFVGSVTIRTETGDLTLTASASVVAAAGAGAAQQQEV